MTNFKALIKHPKLFLRDYLNKKYPIIRNEIRCPEVDEPILLHHDLALEEQIKVNFPIDVVFTWVDDKDELWQKRYQHFKAQAPKDNLGKHATNIARFNNKNELYYSVHSVLKYLPWVRKIYIVTDKQNPEWFVNNERIHIIDHSEIIHQQYLPTFNSHVIEAHLHKIPNLSEHFIYFNDDVFVARSLSAAHFFRSNGVASLFLSKKSLNLMKNRNISTPTMYASLASAALLEKDYSHELDIPLVHTYFPLRKSMFEKCWTRYHSEILKFLPFKFRSNDDLNVATFLAPWLTYLEGNAVPSRDICYYFNINSKKTDDYFMALLKSKMSGVSPHSFCVNDYFFSANKHTEKLEYFNKKLESIWKL